MLEEPQPRSQPEPQSPTPEEIASECQKIQESWSEGERLRRAGRPDGRPERWYPPGVARVLSQWPAGGRGVSELAGE